jgi:peptide/nickel transport system permease protein
LFSKLLYSLAVLLGIVTVVFLLFTALPGDPAQLMLGQRASEEEVQMIRKDLGLDLPIATQYPPQDVWGFHLSNSGNTHRSMR